MGAITVNTETYVFIMGNVRNVPKVSFVGKDKTPGMNLCIEVGRSYKNKVLKDLIIVTAWRTLAKKCERSFKKGDRIYIDGHLETTKDHKMFIIADRIWTHKEWVDPALAAKVSEAK